nr:YSIRK-type signal peptide-containing protein [Lactobacillus crispatus]
MKQRFSIRKITIGAVSVLIGLTFMSYSSQTVHADSVDANSSDSATTSVIKDQTTTEQVASTTKTSNNVDTNGANKTEDTTSIVKTKSTNKVDLSNTDLTTKNNSIDDNSNVGSSIESKNKIATNENKQ